MLGAHVSRLLATPDVELIIHSDSKTSDDVLALSEAKRRYGRALTVVFSDNVHELRGYNKAARYARAPLLLFTQDDALPPRSADYIRFVIGSFDLLGPGRLDALGLLSGKLCDGTVVGKQRCVKYGQCGFADHPLPLTGVNSRTAAAAVHDVGSIAEGSRRQQHNQQQQPPPPQSRPQPQQQHSKLPMALLYVDVVVMGPIVVRADVFRELGSFNTSYSPPGKPGMGFEAAWTSRLWSSGHRVATACASDALVFWNGCGGRGSLHNASLGRAERSAAGYRSQDLLRSEYPQGLGLVRTRVEAAQAELDADRALMRQLHALLPRDAACQQACQPRSTANREHADSAVCHGAG